MPVRGSEVRKKSSKSLVKTRRMTAKNDPVLAELWDNPKDARYDSLRSSVKLNPSRRQTFGARGGT